MINGQVVELGATVGDEDLVSFDGRYIGMGKDVEKIKPIIIAFNKPEGLVCTTSDNDGAINVVDYIGMKERIYPVGRLDKDSSGLLLLTNQGSLTNSLLRAANYHEKEYIVKVNKDIDDEFINNLKKRSHEICCVQIIASGPDSSTKQVRNNFIELFGGAKHHIYIQTPYFIPDEAVLSALIVAVRSGIDVRIMIPCKPDHPFVYWATLSWAGTLLYEGAKVYTYENGFLHAKTVMVDSKCACVGTANMDIRSFELNFEVNAMIYDEEAAVELEDNFFVKNGTNDLRQAEKSADKLNVYSYVYGSTVDILA